MTECFVVDLNLINSIQKQKIKKEKKKNIDVN